MSDTSTGNTKKGVRNFMSSVVCGYQGFSLSESRPSPVRLNSQQDHNPSQVSFVKSVVLHIMFDVEGRRTMICNGKTVLSLFIRW